MRFRRRGIATLPPDRIRWPRDSSRANSVELQRESPRHPASPRSSAPDARTAHSACASTYSWASRCRRFLWAAVPPEFPLRLRPFFVTFAARYSPLGVVTVLQLRNVDSGFLGESMRRRCWLAIFISDVHRWPGKLFGDVRLRGGNAARQSGQTPGGVESVEIVPAAASCSRSADFSTRSRSSCGGSIIRAGNFFGSDL